MTDSFGFNGNGEDEERYANRIEPIKEELAAAVNDPEEMMMIIMEALNNTVTPIPEVGQFYTFIYNAKTPLNPHACKSVQATSGCWSYVISGVLAL